MNKQSAFLRSSLFGTTLVFAILLVGCGDQTGAITPSTPRAVTTPASDTVAAASPATATGESNSETAKSGSLMGPPTPPPTPPPPQGGAPTKFTGTGQVIKDDSGLQYEEMTVGKGPRPRAGQYVQVDYVGYNYHNYIFDESYKRGHPIEFQLGAGRVIKGWEIGIASMNQGGRRMLTIPADLAYGDTPPPGSGIKPYETLKFDVVLVGISDKPTQGTPSLF